MENINKGTCGLFETQQFSVSIILDVYFKLDIDIRQISTVFDGGSLISLLCLAQMGLVTGNWIIVKDLICKWKIFRQSMTYYHCNLECFYESLIVHKWNDTWHLV